MTHLHIIAVTFLQILRLVKLCHGRKYVKNLNISKIGVIRRGWCVREVLSLKHLVILAPALAWPRWRWGMASHQSSWLGDSIYGFCAGLHRFVLWPCTNDFNSFCPQSVKEGWCLPISWKCWTLNSLVLMFLALLEDNAACLWSLNVDSCTTSAAWASTSQSWDKDHDWQVHFYRGPKPPLCYPRTCRKETPEAYWK